MSRRNEPVRKKTADVLEDLWNGHREAGLNGPQHARKYLERMFAGQHSLPNIVKFFGYDLLAEACQQCEEPARAAEAVDQARKYLPVAQEEAARELQQYLPQIRCFEVGIGVAVDEGRFEDALALCEEAIALGLGPVYERKADSIRRMV
jgi:hypothetical protein